MGFYTRLQSAIRGAGETHLVRAVSRCVAIQWATSSAAANRPERPETLTIGTVKWPSRMLRASDPRVRNASACMSSVAPNNAPYVLIKSSRNCSSISSMASDLVETSDSTTTLSELESSGGCYTLALTSSWLAARSRRRTRRNLRRLANHFRFCRLLPWKRNFVDQR